MPPQGEPRKRSVGRRFSSFVALHRRVSRHTLAALALCLLAKVWVLVLTGLTKAAARSRPKQPSCKSAHHLQLREELGPAALRGLEPPPRRSLAGVNKKWVRARLGLCGLQGGRSTLSDDEQHAVAVCKG
jgi:hypothetical protein